MASGETIQSAVEASATQWSERVALQMRSAGQLTLRGVGNGE